MRTRSEFQTLVRKPDLASLPEAVRLAKEGRHAGRETIVAALTWTAFACPEACNAIYDTLAHAWLGTGGGAQYPEQLPEGPLEDRFWDALWQVVDGPEEGYDALSITVAVAALSAALHPDMEQIAEDSARAHPGAVAALTQPVPGRIDIEALGRCPADSLGYSLHRMIVDNGYDLEVLDREAIALSQLPPSLEYLNVRILQMHDVWHLVAGYSTSGSHEIAISGFQLAQFGHNYSSMFLAAGSLMSHGAQPRTFSILMQLILEAWQHGRDTTSFMDIQWEDEWNNSIEDIRRKYGIVEYRSVLPAELLEVANGSFWKKLFIGVKMARLIRKMSKGVFLRNTSKPSVAKILRAA